MMFGLNMLPVEATVDPSTTIVQAQDGWRETIGVLDDMRKRAVGAFVQQSLDDVRFYAVLALAQIERALGGGIVPLDSIAAVDGHASVSKLFRRRLETLKATVPGMQTGAGQVLAGYGGFGGGPLGVVPEPTGMTQQDVKVLQDLSKPKDWTDYAILGAMAAALWLISVAVTR